MAVTSVSSRLRSALRDRMLKRIAERGLEAREAADAMGFDRQQMWRFSAGEDIFSFDRLAEAAAGLGLDVRVRAVRPWGAR